MTSFNVGGRVLDLPANFKLQFVKKNPLFAFDELEVERTTTFAIPKTPNNLLALGFSNDFHRRGEAMRRKVEAQMQSGTVTRDGYLYVGSFNGSEFECIFVTGDLLFLQRLRDLGDISQFIDAGLMCANNAQIVSANQSENTPAGRVNYKTDGIVRPSWLLSEIITQAVTNSGASVDLGNTLQSVAGYRIICGSQKGVAPTPVTLTRTWLAEQVPYNSPETPLTNTMTAQGLDLILDSEVFEYPIFSVERATAQQYYGKVEQVVARQDLVITFPDDTPDTLFIGTALMSGQFDFLGGYSFRRSGYTLIVEGEPLAGRSVEIPTRTGFCLLAGDDLMTGEFEGWRISQGTLSVSVVIEGKKDQPENAIIRAKDNLPEMTVVELLKVLAVLSGRLLSVEGGQVVFADSVEGDTLLDGLRVIKWSELVRTFGDYAQRNTIEFASDEQLAQADRVATTYTLDNENIELAKGLLTIPMSEGSRVWEYVRFVLFVRGDFDGYTLSSGGVTYLEQVTLPKNESLQNVLDKSTSLTMECRFSMYEFDRLNAKKMIYFDGSSWVWTEAQWSNGIARFSLSRI